MHYCNIKDCDISNGPGVRVSLFVSGCRNHCPNCFQPETWNFEYGEMFTSNTVDEILKKLSPDYISGLTILGGEPMEPENQLFIYAFIQAIKPHIQNKTIWLYTGFTFEDFFNPSSRACRHAAQAILNDIDVLVDGKFVEELKDISLQFRGSSNQRIIDMKKTLKENKIVLYEL